MKAGLWDYLKAAFNARPIGMFVPPNWVGLGFMGLLGFVINPGFWLLGAGLELAYLYALTNNPRFRKIVDAQMNNQTLQQMQNQTYKLIAPLELEDRRRYENLANRCRAILEQQTRTSAPKEAVSAQREGLERLLWIYLKLLITRQSIRRIVDQDEKEGESVRDLEQRIANLQKLLTEPNIAEDLKKSLTSQVDILKQRLEARAAARQKFSFMEAELIRIQEQVELIREQSALSANPEMVSQRIDQVTATLGGTNQFIKDQQAIYGQVEDILVESPPISLNTAVEGGN
ncbi:MAG: hypothetical protein HY291_13850 [Planctomycetes bacterium]|nr:hypothetical protein [Planctomycetota bacterium]